MFTKRVILLKSGIEPGPSRWQVNVVSIGLPRHTRYDLYDPKDKRTDRVDNNKKTIFHLLLLHNPRSLMMVDRLS